MYATSSCHIFLLHPLTLPLAASAGSLLLTALNILQAEHTLYWHHLTNYLEAINTPRLRTKFDYISADNDQLFQAEHDHVGGGKAYEKYDASRCLLRPACKDPGLVIHYRTIASENQVMRDRRTRDQIRYEFDILYFEMEAAGLINEFSCIIIQEICNYADSHKNKQWQEHTSAIAAAYAK